MTTLAVPGPVLDALRDKRLRRYHADRVYAELWVSLSYEESRVVKIRQTAKVLGTHRTTLRRALALLIDAGYLVFSHRDSNRRAYYQKVDRRGGTILPPVPVLTADAA